jgi:CRISPR/Cas system-associated exonuclease Cas4 (RecB family)
MKKLDIEFMEILMATSGPRPSTPYYMPRTLSASMIGNECEAQLAYTLRGFPETAGTEKRERLFQMGQMIEPMIIEHMKDMGLFVRPVDPATGKQWNFTSHHGHVKAKLDGMLKWDDAEDEPLELKSMNEERFKKLKKAFEKYDRPTALKWTEPKYYDQVQLTLYLTGHQSGIYLAYNKSSSEYLAIRVPYDMDRILYLIDKIERVLTNNVHRITSDPKATFTCALCAFKEGVCTRTPTFTSGLRTCAHCAFSAPDKDKTWYCHKHERPAHTVCEAFQFFEPKI